MIDPPGRIRTNIAPTIVATIAQAQTTQWVEDRIGERPDDRGPDQVGEEHGRHRRDDVGLEQVGRHPSAIADVVTDVIRDDGRVPGVILRDARLDLPDQVRADVGPFRVDPAADPGEEAHQ